MLAVACAALPTPPPAGAETVTTARAGAAPRAGGAFTIQIGPPGSAKDGSRARSSGLVDLAHLPRWSHGEVVRLLLLGIDRRAAEPARSDTIIVGTVDLRNRRIAAISVPRDLLVDISGAGTDRINAAYAFGELERAGQGPLRARAAIERNFQVSIDHWVAIDFTCFRGTVDALGGIQVDVPHRVLDDAYPTDDWGYRAVAFEPGAQWMNGERSLQYARTRHADSDFGRMRRQHLVLSALRAQLLSVQSLTSLPSLLESCQGLNSDLTLLDLLALGFAARSIPEDRIQLGVIDESMTRAARTAAGASVLEPRWEVIRPFVRETISMPPRGPR